MQVRNCSAFYSAFNIWFFRLLSIIVQDTKSFTSNKMMEISIFTKLLMKIYIPILISCGEIAFVVCFYVRIHSMKVVEFISLHL